MRVVAVLCLMACGRVGFEPTRSNNGGESCTPEICNGIDDDCNDRIDEGCACTPFQVTFAGQVKERPPIAYTGAGYIVLVDAMGQGTLQRITLDGELATVHSLPPLSATSINHGREVLAWTGEQLAVVWTDAAGVWLQRFDGNLGALAAPQLVHAATNVQLAHVKWIGDRFIVQWQVQNSDVVTFVELDDAGAALAEPVTFNTKAPLEILAIAVLPKSYVFGGAGSSTIAFHVDRDDPSIVRDQPLDIAGFGTDGIVFAPAGDRYAATASVVSGTPRFQIVSDAGPVTSGIAIPSIDGFQLTLPSIDTTDSGFRISATGGLPPRTGIVDVDATGGVGASRLIATENGVTSYATPTSIAASRRLLHVLSFSDGSPKLRAVQLCE